VVVVDSGDDDRVEQKSWFIFATHSAVLLHITNTSRGCEVTAARRVIQLDTTRPTNHTTPSHLLVVWVSSSSNLACPHSQCCPYNGLYIFLRAPIIYFRFCCCGWKWVRMRCAIGQSVLAWCGHRRVGCRVALVCVCAVFKAVL
jgi:hypothetical protein